MPVPDYQTLMLPLLTLAGDEGGEVRTADSVERIAGRLGLTESDLAEMLPSQTQRTIVNRVSWATIYMKKAGLLEATRRGYFRITDRGRALLAEGPDVIDAQLLRRYPELTEFLRASAAKARATRQSRAEDGDSAVASVATPSEALENAYEELRGALVDELLVRLKALAPSRFEQVVVDLLLAMGYGGSQADAGRAVGRSGDGGIDGVINEDKLGLDVVYIQAKRWDSNPVGRPDVMQFAGALQAQKATKGVFITTSRFTEEAREYVKQVGSKIVLIDGERLAELMFEYDLGVSTEATFRVKKIDTDYFEEDG